MNGKQVVGMEPRVSIRSAKKGSNPTLPLAHIGSSQEEIYSKEEGIRFKHLGSVPSLHGLIHYTEISQICSR